MEKEDVWAFYLDPRGLGECIPPRVVNWGSRTPRLDTPVNDHTQLYDWGRSRQMRSFAYEIEQLLLSFGLV